jgi:hypothetical protein
VNAKLAVCDGSPSVRELPVLSNGELLLEDRRSAAQALPFQRNVYFDTFSDLNEGDVSVHPVVLTIKGHCAADASGGGCLAVIRENELLGLRDAANREIAF